MYSAPGSIAGNKRMPPLPVGWQNPYPELTEKQGRFVHLVCFDSNASKAARDAGYSKSAAGTVGGKLLKNGRVAARIEELRAELRDRHSATADNIIERYRKMSMGDPVSLVVVDSETGLSRFKTPDELTDDERGMIADVSIRTTTHTLDDGSTVERQQFSYKLVNMKDSLDSLSRTFGLFRDKVEHEHHHKITQLFAFVAANPSNSETVAMLDAKHRKGATIDGSAETIT
jgi:phage terminase small subunit